jgi:hypothetical protein
VISLARTRICFGLLIGILALLKQPAEPPSILRVDLRAYGFVTKIPVQAAAGYTDVIFLTDDLVLVTVNNRLFAPLDLTFSDLPPAKFLLFEVSGNRLLKTIDMRLEKYPGSVKAVEDGRFVILTEAGLQLCTRDLECSPPRPARGPLLVSPAGTRIVVRGKGNTDQVLLDGKTLNELARYASGNPSIVPCDGPILAIEDRKVYFQSSGQSDRRLPFEDSSSSPSARCINRKAVAGFESDKKLAVASTEGNVLFRVPVRARWQMAEVVTSASETRFCFYEKGYTAWNAFVNFLDIDQGRPVNFESISAMSTDSGKKLLELQWDPRPYAGILTPPALSPDGRKLAVIRHGILEIFQIP